MEPKEPILPPEVQAEIDQESFASYTHGLASTYHVGCRGPLCRKANRDKARAFRRRDGREVKQYNTKLELEDAILEVAQRVYLERRLDKVS
jgi:hypothetical protein